MTTTQRAAAAIDEFLRGIEPEDATTAEAAGIRATRIIATATGVAALVIWLLVVEVIGVHDDAWRWLWAALLVCPVIALSSLAGHTVEHRTRDREWAHRHR